MKKDSEVQGLTSLVVSVILLISLITFSYKEPSLNWLGYFGYFLSYGFIYFFGLGAFLIPLFGFWMGWRFLAREGPVHFKAKMLYFCLFLVSVCFLFNLIADSREVMNPLLRTHVIAETVIFRNPYPITYTRYNLGGIPFYFLYRDAQVLAFQHLFTPLGVALIFSLLMGVSLLLLLDVRFLHAVRVVRQFGLASHRLGKTLWRGLLRHPFDKPVDNPVPVLPVNTLPLIAKKAPMLQTRKAEVSSQPRIRKTYTLPPLTLLSTTKKVDKPSLKRELRRQAEILEETLASFGIEAKVGQISCGPTITSFEVHPAIGVKVQKIKALENDIALNMQAKSIRIIAPIPGKAAVGVEVPSLYPQEVGLKEMLSQYQKQHRKFQIPILLGKTVTGDDVMCDLTKMPHCIIAGATGSGKSVCINTIVLSLLMNKTPDELKLLLIDPKKVELSSYAELPHMIAPVITEPHGAFAALNWLVKEMHVRYEMFKEVGVRNIASYNQRESKEGEEPYERMPYLVAIIDEFADLMLTSGTDLETPIARIAQMARAVGIHLILATQRPSREVITGLIKANFPTRIAFKVSSRINSQIILDENGAEALLGNGDLLFMPPGATGLIRAQGVYVCDEDIRKVIDHCTNQRRIDYLIPSFDALTREDPLMQGGKGGSGSDELYQQAVEIVTMAKTASTTFLQRKLKIGYARAASLMDELEAHGVVGPQEGSRPRKINL